jgi:hypothetical protein
MPLNRLHQAILDGRADEVRRLAIAEPELLAVPTDVGTLPLALARARGTPIESVVALIRAEAPGAEALTEWADLLKEYMAEVSERYCVAGWMDGLEFALWSQVTGTPPPTRSSDDGGVVPALADALLRDLEFLTRRAGGWWCWSEPAGLSFVTLETWLLRYDAWIAASRASPLIGGGHG